MSDYDYCTVKYAAANGQLVWEQRYNGPGNWTDHPEVIMVDACGDVVVAGTSVGTSGQYENYTAKYAAINGALLWEHRGLPGYPSTLALDAGGNLVFAGSLLGDCHIWKYAAADGALMLEMRHDSPAAYCWHAALALDLAGNVVATGSESGDYYTVKYAASNGAVQWVRRDANIGGEDLPGGISAVALDSRHNVVVTGYSSNAYSTAKYAATNGALLWERHGAAGKSRALGVGADDNVFVTGDGYTIKYSGADGAVLWRQPRGGTALALDAGGNVVTASIADFSIVKYSATDGTLLWERRHCTSNAVAEFMPAGHNADRRLSVAVDASGNVIVIGDNPEVGMGY
jgi:hypothetical protein